MARRSPLNPRYGKHTAPPGKTRKSAASMKLKRARAERSDGDGKRPESSASKRPTTIVHPATPEYRRWRSVWWGLLASAIVLSTLAWWLWREEATRSIGNWVLAAGYACIFAAIAVDWVKLRVMRREWAERHGDGSPGATKDRDGGASQGGPRS